MANQSTNEKYLKGIEARFKKISNLEVDLTSFPLKSNQISQVETDKKKSKEFSEVFTPLWVVDAMVHQAKFRSPDYQTLDLAAGYGQFSVRLMRHFFNKYPEQFDLASFLKNHSCAELQLSSCYKLLYVFGTRLNLFIGDATQLPKLPETATGIWCYIESFGGWVCLTKTIKNIFMPTPQEVVSEKEFVSSVEKLITYLNNAHEKMTSIYKKVGYSKSTRLEFLKLIKERMSNLFIQTNETPEGLVKEMIDQVDDLEHKSILVLYNAEFVEQLVHDKKIDPSEITFVCEEKKLAEAVHKLYGVECKVVNGKDTTFWRAQLGSKKYDVCLSNPPYNSNLDLRILNALLGDGSEQQSISKEYIVVHPSTWILDKKEKDQTYINFKTKLNKKLKSITFFNGNLVFNVGLFVPCVITHIFLPGTKHTAVKFFSEKFQTENITDITKFGANWFTIAKPFFNKIKKQIVSSGAVWNHHTLSIDDSKYYCQLACIRGNVSKNGELLNEDFYTMCVNDNNTNKGIRLPHGNKSKGDCVPTFEFSSEIERDNFIGYLKTDFARFCLAFSKINAHLDRGELESIPWLDFTQSWDDEKLFKHFDIDQKTQDYIRSYLPDYYGIRKSNQISHGTEQATA